MKDEGTERTIYTRDVVIGKFELQTCMLCGIPYAPQKYLDYVMRNSDKAMAVETNREVCPACARKAGAVNLLGAVTL